MFINQMRKILKKNLYVNKVKFFLCPRLNGPVFYIEQDPHGESRGKIRI